MRFALVLIACVAVCNAYVSIEAPNEKAAKGKCISKDYEFGDFNAGDKKQVTNKCEVATCQDSGAIQYEGCGSVGLPKGCTFVEPDRKAPFPKCCRYEFKCPDKQ